MRKEQLPVFINQFLLIVCFFTSTQNSYSQTNQNATVDSLREVLSHTSEPIERFRILNAITDNVGLYVGHIDSSACIQLLQIAQQVKSDSLLAISYNLIGEYVSRIKGDNASGLNYFFKAIPLAERSNDKRQLSSIYFDMSLIYFNLLNNEEAVNSVRKGGANLPEQSHPLYNFMLAQFQRGMSLYFMLTNQADSALTYAQMLDATNRRLNSPLLQFSVFYISGAAYDQAGEKELAEIWFKKAAELRSVKSFYALQRFSLAYIPFLLKYHRYDDAKNQAINIFNIGAQLGNNDLKLVGAGFMQQVYDSLHQTDSAYHYSKMEAILNAAIFNQSNSNKIQALAFNEQIRIVEEENIAREEAFERGQNIQYALIALGIIIFVTLFLMLSRTVIVNERLISFFAILGLLIVFEFINLLIHPWLAHFTHESPVLMLLALVIIASLLIPLHHRLEHWIKPKMIAKNKAIRLAAAKKAIEKLEGDELAVKRE